MTTGRHARHPRRRVLRWSRAWCLVPAALLLVIAAITPTTSSALTAKITNNDTAATAPYFTCAAATVAATAFFVYPLADTTTSAGASAADISGNVRNGSYNGTDAHSTSKACNRDTGGSVVLSGTTSYISTPASASVTNPTIFTEEIWFKTTTGGGRLIGFGNAQTGTSSQYDRHLYLTNSGQVVFGVYSGAVYTAVSPATYLDGLWHQAAATLSASGMVLYVDGAQVATNTGTTTAENHSGYWRVGFDSISGWGTTQPTNFYFTGSLAWASVYTSALTAAQIKNLYVAGV